MLPLILLKCPTYFSVFFKIQKICRISVQHKYLMLTCSSAVVTRVFVSHHKWNCRVGNCIFSEYFNYS